MLTSDTRGFITKAPKTFNKWDCWRCEGFRDETATLCRWLLHTQVQVHPSVPAWEASARTAICCLKHCLDCFFLHSAIGSGSPQKQANRTPLPAIHQCELRDTHLVLCGLCLWREPRKGTGQLWVEGRAQCWLGRHLEGSRQLQ